MKILVTITNFQPYQGGLEKYIEELFSRLVKRGHKVDLICLDTKKTYQYQEKYRGINVYRVPVWFCFGNIFAIPNLLRWNELTRQLCRDIDYGLLSTQTRFFFTAYLGAKLAKKYHIKHIHTEHGSGYVVHPSGLVRFASWLYDRMLGCLTMKMADQITVVAEGGRQFVKELSGRDAEIVPNGIDINFWDPKKANFLDNDWLSWQKGRIGVLFASRIAPEKGWRLLIDSVAQMDEKKSKKLAIFIAGSGVDEHLVEEYIKEKKVENCVRFVGKQSAEKMRDLLKVCASINLSQREGFQTTLLEAAAMDAFIVTTPVGGSYEVLGIKPGEISKVGMIIKNANVKCCLQALDYLIQRESTRGVGGSEIVSTKYSWDAVVERYLRVVALV